MSSDSYDSDMEDYRAEICTVISKYIENPLELSTFATGGEIDANSMGIPAVVVQNVGRIAYPLCVQQSAALLEVATQAPFGKGTSTIIDVEVRKAWQIESSLVTINQKWMDHTLPNIVSDCCAKLGVDATKRNISAHLYKLLLYEEGGHFKKHKDTEKEPGMFGSLLVQLPAEHEGGCLVVEHDGQSKRFEFAKDSADKAYFASFYADCDHVLEPVTSGLRLVLAFNLVRKVDTTERSCASATAAASASHRRGFEESLVAAARAWCADEEGVEKYVYPLSHEYTQTNVSFGGLKGVDQKVLSLLQGAVDPATNEKLFSVYLALVTKHVTGSGEDDGGDYYGRRGGGGGMSSDADIDTEYETDNWVGPGGAFDFGSLTVDFSTEIVTAADEEEADEVCEAIFGDEPDEEEDEGYCGNYAGTLEYWYRSAVLVFWPARRDFDIKLAASPAQAVSALQAMDRSSADFCDKFARLLAFLRKSGEAWSAQSVFPLAQTVPHAKAVLGMCTRLKLSEADCRTVVDSISRFGLGVLTAEFLQLLESQSLKTTSVLLGMVRAQCPADSSSADSASSAVSWGALLEVLVRKVLLSPCSNEPDADLVAVCQFVVDNCGSQAQLDVARHVGSQCKSLRLACILCGLFKTTLCASSELPPDAAAASTSPAASWGALVQVLVSKALQSPCAEPDADLVAVCRFVVDNCDSDTQVRVAEHMASRLKLRSVNHLLAHVGAATGSAAAAPALTFVRQLMLGAVAACATQNQQPADVIAVVDWVAKGAHADLMATLKPRLLSLCAAPELFRGVFALPSVTAALKSDSSAVGALLESLVQARIDKVAPLVAVPAFSWCMPDVPNTTEDSRVGAFLAGPEERVALYGFGGIAQARRFAASFGGSHSAGYHYSYNNQQPSLLRAYVGAVAQGTGAKAMVVLTKNRGHHDAVAKRCADNLGELSNLRKLVKGRGPAGAAASSSASGGPSSGESALPAQKKQKTDAARASMGGSSGGCISNSSSVGSAAGGAGGGVVEGKSKTPPVAPVREVIEID